MRVGAARPERADGGAAWQRTAVTVVRARPGRRLTLHGEGRVLEVDDGVELLGVQRGQQYAVTQLQDGLGEPGDPGGALQVADRGLHRANGAESRVAGVPGEGLGQRGVLDGVAQGGTGAVRLDTADGAGVDPRSVQRLFHQRLLRLGVGHGVAARPASVVHGTGTDHGMHRVTVADRVRQPLEHHSADALAGYVPGAARAEGPAAAVVRQHGLAAEVYVLVGVHGDVDAAGDGVRALAAADALAGLVHGDEGGGARGVDHHARAAEVAEVGDLVGDGGTVGQYHLVVAEG